MLGSEGGFLECLVLGDWQANCYVIGDRERGTGFVVDPGQGGREVIKQRLEANGVRCEAILLTHGHLDHLWTAPELSADLDVGVRLHREDRYLWDDPGAGFGNLAPGTLEQQFGLRWEPPHERLELFDDGATMTLGGFTVTARHTPGHTPGSSVFLLRDVIVSGDLIFAGSVGRTDFPRGSWGQQMDAIARVVLPLDDATVIVSGHGPETTVGAERATNPFLRELV